MPIYVIERRTRNQQKQAGARDEHATRHAAGTEGAPAVRHGEDARRYECQPGHDLEGSPLDLVASLAADTAVVLIFALLLFFAATSGAESRHARVAKAGDYRKESDQNHTGFPN